MFEDDEEIDYKSLPIYLKGKEIMKAVERISELIPEDNAALQEMKILMFEDASKLAVKVAGAQGAGLYDLKM